MFPPQFRLDTPSLEEAKGLELAEFGSNAEEKRRIVNLLKQVAAQRQNIGPRTPMPVAQLETVLTCRENSEDEKVMVNYVSCHGSLECHTNPFSKVTCM